MEPSALMSDPFSAIDETAEEVIKLALWEGRCKE